jgi:hypothetical protein
MMTHPEVANWIRTHTPGQFVQEPNERQKKSTAILRAAFDSFKLHIMAEAPDCRERSLALTHLEDACSRAIQAVMYHVTEGEH